MAGTRVELGYSKNVERQEVEIQENCDSKTETKFMEYQDGNFTAYSREEIVECPDGDEDSSSSREEEYFMDTESKANDRDASELANEPEVNIETESTIEAEGE